MSRSRQKGTSGENFFLGHLRALFGPQVERAPLKGVLDMGDFVGVPWLHESKSTLKPLFQQWARVCEKKHRDWVILWKGDLRTPTGNGPYVLMPLHVYEQLVIGSEYEYEPPRPPDPFDFGDALKSGDLSVDFRERSIFERVDL